MVSLSLYAGMTIESEGLVALVTPQYLGGNLRSQGKSEQKSNLLIITNEPPPFPPGPEISNLIGLSRVSGSNNIE